MKKVLYSACAVLMLAAAVVIWYLLGITIWTLIVGLFLLSCPMLAIVVALRVRHQTDEAIHTVVMDELRRRHS